MNRRVTDRPSPARVSLALDGLRQGYGLRPVTEFLMNAEGLNRRVHRPIGANALGREFSPADISMGFRANGKCPPRGADS